MWIITRDGFVSLVEHATDHSKLRARARRVEHLQETFDLRDGDIIDLGPNAPDYRWHADIPKLNAAQAIYDAVMAIDYESHVKEEVAGDDRVMYSAMLGCWRELYKLQDPPGHLVDAPEPPSLAALGDIAEQIGALAERMHGARLTDDDDESVHDPLSILRATTGTVAGDECAICGNDFNDGDYVMLPADEEPGYEVPAEPAHPDCAESEGWTVAR